MNPTLGMVWAGVKSISDTAESGQVGITPTQAIGTLRDIMIAMLKGVMFILLIKAVNRVIQDEYTS